MNEPVLAVIPAFNEATRIGTVVAATIPQVQQVVVVDDGSTDQTAQAAEAAGARVLRHPVNRGKGAAILTALHYFHASAAEYAVFLDADGQHDPREIGLLMAAARRSGAALVVGTRMAHTRQMPWVRRWANRLTSRLTSRLAGQAIPDSQCGYRLLHRRLLQDLRLSTRHFETETEILIQAGRAGHQILSVPVRTIYNPGRHSRIQPGRDTVRFLRLVWRYRKRA